MCSTELLEWLDLIVFESNGCLKTVLSDLRSMTPEERQGFVALREDYWLQFNLDRIEVELAGLVEKHGDAITVEVLGQLERAAA